MDDIIVRGTQLSPSDTEGNIEVYIPDDHTPESREEFSISINISNIQPVNGSGVHVSIEGGPIRIVVYDNDCKLH